MYQVMVLSTNEAKAQYISAEEQDKMQQYVIHMTIKDISPELKKIIGVSDAVIQAIKDKAFL